MYLDSGAVLRQLAKTAALVAALGLLLYLGVAALAEREDGHWLIGLVLAAPMAVLTGWLVLDALRCGVFPMRFSSPTREGQPVAYWFNVVWFSACGVLFGAIAVWCAAVLLGG